MYTYMLRMYDVVYDLLGLLIFKTMMNNTGYKS